MLTKPRLLLALEGAVVFAACLFAYRELHLSWLMFAVLFLAPDVFMLGYLAGVKAGAAIYNLVHTLTGPLVLLGCAVLMGRTGLLPYGLIWVAHIGFDRMLGFGLKYPTHFKDTHLQRV